MKKILSVILCIVICFSAFSLTVCAQEEVEINVGEVKEITLLDNQDEAWVKFVPDKDGWYRFYSTGDFDTVCGLYDEEKNELDANDDFEDYNFSLFYEMEADAIYYFRVTLHETVMDTGSFQVALEEAVEPDSISISVEGNIVLDINESYEIEVSVDPSNAIQKYTVETEEDIVNIIHHDTYFEIYAYKPGTTKVTVSTVNGISKSFNVTVNKPTAIALNEATTYTLTEADEGYCIFIFTPSVEEVEAYNLFTKNYDDISVKVSGTDGFTVVGTGINLQRPVKCWAGESYEIEVIGGKAGDQIAIAKYNVKFEGVEIVEKEYFGKKNEAVQLEYNFKPLYASRGTVYFTSSDTSVAEVDEYGVVTFMTDEGTAEIRVECNGFTDAVTVTAKSDEKIEVGFEKEYQLPAGSVITYKFTPEESGRYLLYTEGAYDTIVSLYDENYNTLDGSDDVGENLNCKLGYYYEAGKTYYLELREISGEAAEFIVYFEEEAYVTSIEILNLPYEQTIYPENIEDVFFDGLEIRFNFSDGSFKDVNHLQDYSEIDYYIETTDVTETEIIYTVFANDVSCEFTLPLTYNPVQRIDVDDDFKITLYENAGGVWNEEENYYWYKYIIPDDLELTVYYKDGTEKKIKVNQGYYDGEVWLFDDQSDEHWYIGGEHYVKVRLSGLYDFIPVEIIENPVVSAEVTKLPNKTEYVFGEVKYGYVDEENNYWVTPDFTGMEITLTLDDGEKEIYAFDDNKELFLDIYNLVAIELVAEDKGKLDVSFEFFGADVSFPIDIVSSKIANIEIIKYPENVSYHYSAFPDICGMEIKISYVDGSSKIVTVSQENIGIMDVAYYLHLIIECGEEDLIYYRRYDEPVIEGGTLSIPVDVNKFNVIEEEVVELEVTEFNAEELTVGMHIVFENGEEKDIEVKVLDGLFLGYCELGILECYFDADIENGKVNGLLFVFDGEFEVEFSVGGLKGDCNGDGEINTVDLANLKLYLAGLGEIGNNADMNGDGNVDTVDLAQLKLSLAGL